MKHIIQITALLTLLISCQQIKPQYKLTSDINLEIMLENYQNVIEVEVIKLSFTKREDSYPVLIEIECKVIKTFQGNFSEDTIQLITAKEEMIDELYPKFDNYIYFFNQEDKNKNNSYIFEFRLLEKTANLNKRLKKL